MIVTPQSTESFAKREAGGKGFNLFLLSQAGLPVPSWVVVGARYFKQFREQSGLDAQFAALLAPLSAQSEPAQFESVSQSIRSLILKTSLPLAVEATLRAAYQKLGCPLIAVRSSGVDEDSARFSFAGQLSTYLFVKSEEEALRSIRECWASGFSTRGLSYRAQNGLLGQGPIEVAVVLQEMVDCEKSGVLFTCDPTTQDGKKVMINSVYGIGEGLVSGLLDADTFVLEKSTGKKLSEQIVDKGSQLVRNESGEGTVEAPVSASLISRPSLDDGELEALARIGRDVEGLYRFPQDVEWGWREGRFYLLQARPVTTPVRNEDGLLYIWDNSNIVESYGGITMPLTFSFAHHVYHWVYIQFCEILLVPSKEIRKMDSFLKNMLGLFYGRVFYNILNWYKLTSILPGFKYNRKFMETMMGTQHSLADEIADRIKPPGFQERWISKVRRFVTGLKFLYFHFTIQKMVDEFLEYFHSVYGEYRKRNYSRMPSDEIFKDYQELEEKLLMEWKAPIVNDYLCMVHFGILKNLTGLWLSKLGDSLQNDLLCGEGNLESAEPTRELIRMAALVAQNPALRTLIERTPPQDGMEALVNAPEFSEFRARVDRYIDLYGFRCMNEMKLEERDLYQDPSFLFVCLKNYLRSGQTDLKEYEKREKEIRHGAEKKVHENLTGLKKKVYLWSLKHARKAVRNRENTRFCRTRIYGIARAMFYGMGRDFVLRSILDRPEDIFYLQIQEIFGALEGTLTVINLRALVDVRKKEYATYVAQEPSSRFHTRGPTYWMNDHFPEHEVALPPIDLPDGALKGIGCCPGIVEGTVKVILSPQDDMELNGEILVTVRTDPGWIPLYPSASGLIVERGGLLSHSAIVAREMGLPTIVGVQSLTKKLRTGMKIRMNGETGVIENVEGPPL